MKKTIYSILTIVAATLLGSCTPTVDEIFDADSVERADRLIAEDMKVLASAPNGWRMEYYGDATYGGYNVFLDFNEDKTVTVASELVGKNHKGGLNEGGKLNRCTSAFRMEQSQGIILSFCEYNDIFHYFSEPKNPDYGSAGEGFYGDFEFRVLSCTADSVVMKGRKHNSKIVMYPIAADQSWEDLHNSIVDTEKYMASRSYSLWKDEIDQNVFVSTSYRRLVFTYYEHNEGSEDSTLVQKSVPYVVTPEGFKFYRNVDVKNMTLTSLDKGVTDEYFYDSNDKSIQLYAYIPSLAEYMATSMWFITYSNLGSYAKPYWDKMKTSLKKAGPNGSEATCYWAAIGYYNSKVGFHMQAGDDYVLFGLDIKAANEEGTQITIKPFTKDNNKPGTTYYQKNNLNQALIPFIGARGGGVTFNLETDNMRKPTYMKLTDTKNANNVITLWADEVYYPFDN